MIRFSLVLLVCAVFLAGANGPAHAQSAANSGQIVGQVVDSTGAAIVGGNVTIRNVDTNLTRRAVTDESGRYAVSLLPPGPYEVTATIEGLQPSTQAVAVTLGNSVNTTLVLGVAGVVTDVQVTGSRADVMGAPGRAVLTDVQLRNLPASGRRIRSMFQLTPGSQIEPECGGFAVSGQKGTMVNINVDGGDCTNLHWTGHLESTPTMGLEALQEMQVLRSTFSAEFGRSTGGIVNMSTRSGTNLLRGTGYYLFRNDALTKNDALGRDQIGVGQQFGGSVGGPLRADRTFFFVAPEFQRNTKPVQTLYAALDTQNLRGTSAAQELLAVAPERQHEAVANSSSVVARMDHRLNDAHGFMGRVDYIRNHVVNSTGSFNLSQGIGAGSVTNRDLTAQAFLNDRNTTTALTQFTSVLSNRLIGEVRGQIFKETRPSNTDVSGPEVNVRNAGAAVAIYGPQATGLSYGNTGYTFDDTRYQAVGNLSLVTGGHTAKFGVDVNVVDARSTFDPGSNGIYTFNSLADYVARRPFQYQQFAGTGTVRSLLTQSAFYVQDEWRVTPKLTISPGLRYEFVRTPDYQPATVPDYRFPLATGIPGANDLIAPRLGVAWDARGDGKTVVRAAGGLFYAAPFVPIYDQALLTNGGNPELSSQIVITTTGNPNAVTDAFRRIGIDLATAPLGRLPSFTRDQLNLLVSPENRIGQTVNFIDPDFKLPRATQMRLAVERQLGTGLLGSLDFTNVNTARIARVRNLNLEPPVPDATGRPIYGPGRPYGSKYGFVQVTESSARSSYQALTSALNINRHNVVVDLYYTLSWSKSHDDFERPVNAIFPDDAYNMNNEYTWSNIDQRHQFAASGLFFLPKALEVSTTMRMNSGRPFSQLAGTDLNRDGTQRDRAVIDGAVVTRNTFRNSAYYDANLRLQRGFTLANARRIVFSLELFNVFDFDNVEVGSSNMVWGPGTVIRDGRPVVQDPPANFGQVKDANGTYYQDGIVRSSPFQAQLGLRFEF